MGPVIRLWDIETTHNLVAVFRLFGEDYIPHENIVKERYVVTAAWKDLGEKKVHAVSLLDDKKRFKRDPDDDYHVCATLHNMLSTADVIVAHNGDHYDIKFTEARMLKHGLPPLPPILSIDTLKEAKRRFLFNSNRLDYLSKFLGGKGKKSTPKGLWLKVLLEHDEDAIRTMVSYNKQDVLELEFLYNKLSPYIKSHNRQVFGSGPLSCTHCGSTHYQSRGVQPTKTGTYKRYQCVPCRGWFADNKRVTGATQKAL
jgi:hypothetical protein